MKCYVTHLLIFHLPHIFRDVIAVMPSFKGDFLDRYRHFSETHNPHLRVARSFKDETSISERHIVSFWDAGIRFVQNVGKFLQLYKCHNPEEIHKFSPSQNFQNSCIFSHVSTPLVGQDLLFEVPRSHSDRPHSVGLLWTSDRPVEEQN
jgi:hypothetical protein